ncbi:MAG: hypothetical protein JWO38_1679 [Gemmataceae bacterium]|nr:hypothetical protein [Gemmataceae bacterium]
MLGAEGISSQVTTSAAPAAKPGATVRDTAAARVKEMAREFEATFLSMILKEMRETLDPEGGLFPGDSGDVQGGLFDMFLGRHLADSGGVGLAATLERNVRPASAARPGTSTDGSHPPLPAHGRLA